MRSDFVSMHNSMMMGFCPALSLRGAKRRGNPYFHTLRPLQNRSVQGERIATPVCGLVRNDIVILNTCKKLAAAFQADHHNLKYYLLYQSMVGFATGAIFRQNHKKGRKNFRGPVLFVLIFSGRWSKIKTQSKIGSCNEVFRTRAATITRLCFECTESPWDLVHFLFF